jgi:hypothetical protein
MKKQITAGLLALATATIAGTAQAQSVPTSPLSLEVRGGLAFPTGSLADVAESGYTLGGNATFNFTPQLGLYVGGTFNSFPFGDNVDATYRDYGLDAGVKASFAGPALPVTPFLKGGLVYHKLELKGDEVGGDDTFKSDLSLGFEVGGGFMIPLGPRLSFTPAVTYMSYEPKFEDDSDEESVSHVRVDVGLNVRL